MSGTDRESGGHAQTIVHYCRDALPKALNLRALPGISHAFFGWSNYTPAVDAGMPPAVVRVFSTVLCARFHLTFIGDAVTKANASNRWSRAGEYWTQTQARLLKRAIPLVWTQSVSVAQAAFDQGWTTEGQFILLSIGPDPIQFDAYALQGDVERVLAFVQLCEYASGALLPGVDGAFAGLYLRDAPLLTEILERDLVEACRREGVILRAMSGREFMLLS
jgi:hypothetical protein